MSKLTKTNRLQERAMKSIPLGVNSNGRFWGENKTPYFKAGKGAYIWDVDDNRFIDYRLGFGPVILGYAFDEVDEKVIEAIRALPPEGRPRHLFGCEVWRDLDWLSDADKTPLDVSKHENLQAALLGVFDSQICGGKRYDLATLGRRQANATYFASHGVDTSLGLNFAMDLTPLIKDATLKPEAFVQALIRRFAEEVGERIRRVTG